MSFLELQDIHKSYYLGKEEFPVLKGIDLSFERGEFVSILGESGGGKSTLMNIIGGLDRHFEGQVIIDGRKLDHKKEKQLDDYRRGTIGYIYQSYNLITHLTVLDNVLVSLNMTTLSLSERKARAIELLTQVGLGDHIKKHPNQLSGGQKQRVAIARALASDPDIIIADEPTGALDAQNTKEVLEILTKIAKNGKLVIAVTHSHEVADHGTRIVKLSDGKIDDIVELQPAFALPQDSISIEPKVLSAAASYQNAFNHLSYNFWRNSLIMLGTAIGIFAVLLFSGLGNGVTAFIHNQIDSMINPTAVSVMKNPTGEKLSDDELQLAMGEVSDPADLLISDEQLTKLETVENVAAVEPGYQVNTYTIVLDDENVTGAGMQTWTSAFADDTLKKGQAPGENEIVLDKGQAVALTSADTYQELIGQTVTLAFPWLDEDNQPIQVEGEVEVVGISDAGQAGALTGTDYQTLHDLIAENDGNTAVSFVSVMADESENVKQVAKDIQNLKDGDDYLFGSFTVGDILDTVNQYVSIASTVLSAIAGVSLVVSALMIIVTMYMSVSERTKEIGILRALGQRKKDIRRLFTSESILIGLFSAVLALGLAYGFSAILNQVLYNMVEFNMVQITWVNVVSAFVIALVISFLAALLPSRRAARLNPIDALSAD
ncbi:MAG: ATP-binding cassette domain-containing protein [Enterococcus sp.]